MKEWFQVLNSEQIFSPALVVYPEWISYNIQTLLQFVGGETSRLRPHIKTHKMVEVTKQLLRAGILQFKCSTLAEAEMLALAEAKDVLLSYQLVGPNILRWAELKKKYPLTHFSSLVDNVNSIQELGTFARNQESTFSIYIDLDLGMGRTGIHADGINPLISAIKKHPYLHLEGLHGYDGHIHNADLRIRQLESEACYALARQALSSMQRQFPQSLQLVLGGSPSFSFYAQKENVICSPGTFIFWDWGYRQRLAEQGFHYAALVFTRVISIIDETRICVDLGYKAVASDPPLPRVKFLNADDAQPLIHSEEHLVLQVKNSSQYPIGTILYGVPMHICPTVALYDEAMVIREKQWVETWEIIARKRKINV